MVIASGVQGLCADITAGSMQRLGCSEEDGWLGDTAPCVRSVDRSLASQDAWCSWDSPQLKLAGRGGWMSHGLVGADHGVGSATSRGIPVFMSAPVWLGRARQVLVTGGQYAGE